MSSTNIETNAQRPINPCDIKLFSLSVGEFFVKTSKLSEDIDTQSGILLAQEVLLEKGIVLLDLHQSRFDIIYTAVNLANEIPFSRFTAPAAGKHENSIKYGYIIDQLNQVPGVNIMFVNRREEMEIARANFTHKPRLSQEEIVVKRNKHLQSLRETNTAYLETVKQELAIPGSGVLIAPYGSSEKYGDRKSIRDGVVQVLCETGSPALITLSVFEMRRGGFVTYTSGALLNFSRDQDPQEVKGLIHSEMMFLKLRVDHDLSLI